MKEDRLKEWAKLYPKETVDELVETLKANRKAIVYTLDGALHITAESEPAAPPGAECKMLRMHLAVDIFGPEEMIANYVTTNLAYPEEYYGERSEALMRDARDWRANGELVTAGMVNGRIVIARNAMQERA
jgi:hypothetical protein